MVVLGTHALRHRFGLIFFYALIGSITALMSWITDAGMRVDVGLISFNVGSTVFYTALLLGVFVIYVFEGPRVTRHLILTIVLVSTLTPLIAIILHMQNALMSSTPMQGIPLPSLRINIASVMATLANLVFLAIIWEALAGKNKSVHLMLRTFLTLIAVMWLDVILFTTGAFWGTPNYWQIMGGTFASRSLVAVMAFPLLYLYLRLESSRKQVHIENRPILSILRQMAEINAELTHAQAEIERRKEVEAQLKQALTEVKTLRGLIPICAGCKKIRDDKGLWEQIESYVTRHSDARFSHGLCPDCVRKYYPDEDEIKSASN
ncbi:MAG: VUT family protein [Lentisphaerae bacterium]|nr:VUT family protein [Lentisphaerota bacterium]